MSLGAADLESSESLIERIFAADKIIMVGTRVFLGLAFLLFTPLSGCFHSLGGVGLAPCSPASAMLDPGTKRQMKETRSRPPWC